MSTKHVVFLEPQGGILEGMMPELTTSHPDWHVVRVAAPGAAMQILEQYPVGIVVANLGTDRKECERFFGDVKMKDRNVVRMGLMKPLRGRDDLAPLDVAHQCLALDSSTEQIGEAIDRGLSIWERCYRNPRLSELTADLKTLPTPPTLYFDIRDELDSPNGSFKSVARIVSRDPALTAKVLRVANSGFFSYPRTIANLHEAIMLLGVETLQALVLAVHLYDRLPLPGLNLDKQWTHCVAVAAYAKMVAHDEGADRNTATISSVAGLLHDVGQLILLMNDSGAYYPLILEANGDERRLMDLENERFGVGHPELGAYLFSLWGLPDDVVDAVACHHDLDEQQLSSVSLPAKSVYLAEWLLRQFSIHRNPEEVCMSPECPNGIVSSQVVRWWSTLEELVDTVIFS